MEKILKKIESFLEERKKGEIFDKIEEFHNERIKKLKNNETPKPFPEGGKIVLHLIPMESFRDPKDYDILASKDKTKDLLKPIWENRKPYKHTYNFDGLLNLILMPNEKCISYVQLYRNGIIEAVEGFYLTSERKDIPIYSIEKDIILYADYYLLFQKGAGFNPPIICYLTLLGVRGYSITITDRSVDTNILDIHPFERESLILPKIIINDFGIDTKKMFKTSLDRIWNACGYPRSFQYNEKGEFIAR